MHFLDYQNVGIPVKENTMFFLLSVVDTFLNSGFVLLFSKLFVTR